MLHQTIFSFLFLLFFTSNLVAQEVYASPEELKSAIVDIRYSNPEKAFELAQALLDFGIKNSDQKVVCEAYHQLGKIKGIMGEHRASLQYYNNGLNIARGINYTEYHVELLTVMGNAYLNLNEDEQALTNYLKALDISKTNQFKAYIEIIRSNIALLKQRSGKYEEAIELYKENLAFHQENPEKNKVIQANLISQTLMSIGEVYLLEQKLDSALFYHELGLQNSLTSNDLETTGNFLKFIGIVHYYNTNYNIALENLFEAEKKFNTLGNELIKAEIYYRIGQCYQQQQKPKASTTYYLQAIEIIDQNSASKPLFYADTCKQLAIIFKETGDAENSIVYYEKYVTETTDNQDQKLKFIEKIYENDIQGLENELSNFSKLTSKQQTYIAISFSLIVLLVIVLLVYIKVVRKKHFKDKNITNQLLDQFENEQKSANTLKTPIIIKDRKIEEIMNRLHELELDFFYLNKDCNLYTVSQQLNTNTTYLSKIINTYKKKKFNAYINDLRINYAIDKIKNDKKFRAYSVKSMALELGYKSADSFAKYFKMKTNLFPSNFIKSINSIEKSS